MDLVSTDHEINRLWLAVVLVLIHSFVSLQQFVGTQGVHKCILPYDMLRVFRRNNVAPWCLHLTPEIENKMDSDKCTFRHHAMLKRMIHRKQHYDHRLVAHC
jgi:hypothetical protein